MENKPKYELDDSFWPRWIKWLPLTAIIVFVGYFAVYCYAWRLHGLPMRIGSIYLLNLHRGWLKDGSPINPVITNYVTSTRDRFFIWTNNYTFNGSNFVSQFGLETSLLGERGILVVSRDGRLAWIDKKTGPEMFNP